MGASMIAILINSLAAGGAEKVVLHVTSELIKRGYKIKLICIEQNQFYQSPDGVNIEYLSKNKGEEKGLLKFIKLPILAIKLFLLIKKHKIKVVQSHLFRANYVNILSKFFGSKHQVQIVNTVSISAEYKNAGLPGKINIFLIRVLYPKADLIIAKSKGMLLDIDKYINFSKNKIIIYNPAQTKMIESKQKEKIDKNEFKFLSNKKYIITMARMHPHKCIDVLINAFSLISKRCPDTDLICLGDGNEKSRLERLIADFNLSNRVHLPGQVQNPYKYLAYSNFFVLPSSSEGFPNSIIEAMICKLPVISTDCLSGPREIIAPNTDISIQNRSSIEYAEYGILVPVNNSIVLAEAIENLLINKKLYLDYSEKGYLRAQDFSSDIIIDEYEKILTQGKK